MMMIPRRRRRLEPPDRNAHRGHKCHATMNSRFLPFLIFLLHLIFFSTLSHASTLAKESNSSNLVVITSEETSSLAPHHHVHHAHHQHHPHHHHSTPSSPSSSPPLASSTTAHSLVVSPTVDESELPLLPLLPPEDPAGPHNPKGLRFEEEPSDSFIVRSKSAVLRCKTLNALNAWFTCNSGDERRIQSNQKIANYVDPQTGVRLIEIDLEITRSDVEEHQNSGYTNLFQCWCTAYGGHHQIMSRKASVSFSYLKKHFLVNPSPVTAGIGAKQVTFHCDPPDGDPTPTVFWMKNDVIIMESEPRGLSSRQLPDEFPLPPGLAHNQRRKKSESQGKSTTVGHRSRKSSSKPVVKDDHEEEEYDDDYEDEDEEFEEPSKRKEEEVGEGEVLLSNHFDSAMTPLNYRMAPNHSLIIQRVSPEDHANYTCGVYNQAGVRFSQPALLTIFVNGEWSNWGTWSPCIMNNGVKCGTGTQKRIRHCSNPAPMNNGQFCVGEAMQVADCNVHCSPIDGFWSPWSAWSTCSHDCTQVRRRVCNNPSPAYGGLDCFGPDFLVKNCTGGLCGRIKTANEDTFPMAAHPKTSQSNEQIYFLIISILVLIILSFVIYIALRFHLHRRRQHVKSFHWIGDATPGTTVLGPTDRADPEEAQGMLLLLQQGNTGSRLYKPSPHHYQQSSQSNHYPLEPITRSPALDKYQLISRLNSNNNNLDHFLMPSGQQGPPQAPLPTIPSVNSLSTNKYEEPTTLFHSPSAARSTHHASTTPPGGSSSQGTGTSTTTATITTSDSSEPDYAEPMVPGSGSHPPPISVPPLPPGQSPRYSGGSTSNSSSHSGSGSTGSSDVSSLCGRHEKFIKLTSEIVRFGHFSLMPKLGVGVYLTPNVFPSLNRLESDTYLRYGVDTSARSVGHCSLSSVLTVSFSKPVSELHRPLVLCFRHCLSVPLLKPSDNISDRLGQHVVVLWQPSDSRSHGDTWIEIVRYGEENLNTSSYLQCDSSFAYLVTTLLGRFMLAVRSPPGNDNDSVQAPLLSSPYLSCPPDLSKLVNFAITVEQLSSNEHLVKVFVYDHLPASSLMLRNELPSSSTLSTLLRVMIGKIDQSGRTSTSVLRLSPRAGNTLCFELQLSGDSKKRRIKGMRRMEIPIGHLWSAGPNSLLHCSFVVVNSEGVSTSPGSGSDLEVVGEDEDSSDLLSCGPSSPTYENSPSGSRRAHSRSNLHYEVRVWQKASEVKPRRGGLGDQVLLSRTNMLRVRQIPGNVSQYYLEDSLHLLSDTEMTIRGELVHHLDKPRSDQLDWRQLASVCHFDHYLPFFASQPSPSTQIMELWEARVFLELMLQSSEQRARKGYTSSAVCTQQQHQWHELFYSKLVHLLQTIQRTDLIDVILSRQLR